jgi:hypothetical protein
MMMVVEKGKGRGNGVSPTFGNLGMAGRVRTTHSGSDSAELLTQTAYTKYLKVLGDLGAYLTLVLSITTTEKF